MTDQHTDPPALCSCRDCTIERLRGELEDAYRYMRSQARLTSRLIEAKNKRIRELEDNEPIQD